MQLASLEDFERDPVGRFVCGDRYAHFCVAPRLWGILLRGRPSEAEARELGRSLVFALGPPAIPHAVVVDTSELEGGDAGGFGAAQRFLARNRDRLTQQITRLALVRPAGLSGAMVSGAFEVLPRPFPVSLFTDVGDALAWLAPASEVGGTEALAAVTLVRETAARVNSALRALRAYVEAHLGDATLAAAAKACGASERSLQRRLADAGTTFQDELVLARVRAAERLLAESDAPLTEIALEVGCASLQHFSTMFRKQTGDPPSEWRRKRRRPDGGP